MAIDVILAVRRGLGGAAVSVVVAPMHLAESEPRNLMLFLFYRSHPIALNPLMNLLLMSRASQA